MKLKDWLSFTVRPSEKKSLIEIQDFNKLMSFCPSIDRYKSAKIRKLLDLFYSLGTDCYRHIILSISDLYKLGLLQIYIPFKSQSLSLFIGLL